MDVLVGVHVAASDIVWTGIIEVVPQICLVAFTQRKRNGGKLIVYHGLSDPDIAPLSSTNYYEQVAAKLGAKSTAEFMRVYLVPGMQHCGNGPGATVLGSIPGSGADPQRGIQAALERWVEKKNTPAEIIATKYKPGETSAAAVERTRPICAYPKIAHYKGTGSTDAAASYSCVDEP